MKTHVDLSYKGIFLHELGHILTSSDNYNKINLIEDFFFSDEIVNRYFRTLASTNNSEIREKKKEFVEYNKYFAGSVSKYASEDIDEYIKSCKDTFDLINKNIPASNAITTTSTLRIFNGLEYLLNKLKIEKTKVELDSFNSKFTSYGRCVYVEDIAENFVYLIQKKVSQQTQLLS